MLRMLQPASPHATALPATMSCWLPLLPCPTPIPTSSTPPHPAPLEVCGRCWRDVSGGVVDGDEAHPHYRYGGLWRNLHKPGASKQGS